MTNKVMIIRIYDISKKLGLENKVILAKAKALGITGSVLIWSFLILFGFV